MNNLNEQWIQYNVSSNILAKTLGRTSNIVGEYGEYVANKYYQGELTNISGSSADIKTKEGILYQVKTRRLPSLKSTQLGIIRSWNFHYLVVIIFDLNGLIQKALEVPVNVAKEYGVKNSHQHGWVITTTQQFLKDERAKDITSSLIELINSL